jgi:hypothetical protein
MGLVWSSMVEHDMVDQPMPWQHAQHRVVCSPPQIASCKCASRELCDNFVMMHSLSRTKLYVFAPPLPPNESRVNGYDYGVTDHPIELVVCM